MTMKGALARVWYRYDMYLHVRVTIGRAAPLLLLVLLASAATPHAPAAPAVVVARPMEGNIIL